MRVAIASERLRKEMGLNARKYVEENYSWRAVAEKINYIYQRKLKPS